MTKGLITSWKGVSTFPEILSRYLHTCKLTLGDRDEIQGLTCSPTALLVTLSWCWLTGIILPLQRNSSRARRSCTKPLCICLHLKFKKGWSSLAKLPSWKRPVSLNTAILGCKTNFCQVSKHYTEYLLKHFLLVPTVALAGLAMDQKQKWSPEKIFTSLALLTKLLSASLACGSEIRTKSDLNS